MTASLSGPALNVSRETEADLDTLESLVRKWNPAINLVASSTLSQLRTRHTLDSAQIFDLAPADAKKWVDLGSGGGFPGLVVAILAKHSRPDLSITLVESDLRKATFLREAVRTLVLAVEVLSARIESLQPLDADVISARALAPLPALLGLTQRHLKPTGVAIFPKGQKSAEEIEAAQVEWRFRVDTITSLSDSNAAILMIRNIQRADER